MSERKRPAVEQDPHADLEFEDEYGDDYEEGSSDEEMVEGEEGEEGEEEEEEGATTSADGVGPRDMRGRLYRAGDAMGADEVLDFDGSAYDMLHRLHMEWPCMTFGSVRDSLGEQRTRFPLRSAVMSCDALRSAACCL